ncbi:MAG: hypothetical protein ABIH41_02135 [Nanoarchaeota archaeon]
MKCQLCSKKMEENFLQKPMGTYVRDAKGKQHPVCQTCQKAKSMDEIKKALG